MSQEETKNNAESTEEKALSDIIRASVYESTDKNDSGGVTRTRIYCFETNKPILPEGR
jgi:hypothetical protein